MNAYKEIQNALLKIKAGEYHSIWGICSNIDLPVSSRAHGYWSDTREAAFMDWSKFSGDSSYPVPYKCPGKAEYAYEKFNKWSKGSQYGRDRWELLDHLIEWYGKKADENEA